jgi:aminotransferase
MNVNKFAKKELLSMMTGSTTRVNVALDPKLINLAAGDPDFNQPNIINKAVYSAMKEGHTHYTFNGVPEFRQAIAKYYGKYGVKIDPDSQICIESGGSQAIFRSFGAILNPGDEIILLDPAYQGYYQPATYFGAKIARAPMRKDKKGLFRPDFDAIAKVCSQKTKAVMICNPDNPTGVIYSQKELESLAEVCIEKDILCISDEIYTEFTWGRKVFVPTMKVKGMEDRTLALMSFSKTFAWTGCRAGYIIGCPDLINLVSEVPTGIMGMPIPFQYAGAVALEKCWGFVKKMRKEYKKRIDFSVKRLNEIEGITCPYPEGTFYLFPDISEVGMPSAKFFQELFLQEKVRGAPGTNYGNQAEGHIRFALVDKMDRLEEAWNRVEQFVKRVGANKS